MNTLGAVNYLSLYGYAFETESAEALLAFYLLWALQVFGGYTMVGLEGSVEDDWETVQFLIVDLLPEGIQVKNLILKRLNGRCPNNHILIFTATCYHQPPGNSPGGFISANQVWVLP